MDTDHSLEDRLTAWFRETADGLEVGDPPAPETLGNGRAPVSSAASASGRRRVRLLAAAAATVVAVAGVGVLIASRDEGETVRTVEPPATTMRVPEPEDAAPPVGEVDFDLWVSEPRVPVGGATVFLSLQGDPAVMAENDAFGVPGFLDRWDGQGWVPFRHWTSCVYFWPCEGRLSEEPEGGPDFGLLPGSVEVLRLDGLAPGWYRLRKASARGLMAAGVVEVTTDPVVLVDVGDPSGHRLGVFPFLVPAGGEALVEVALIGASTIEESEALDAALSTDASLDRWIDDAWQPAVTIALEAGEGVTARRALLPPLEPGAYRITRSGDGVSATGVFWVIDDTAGDDPSDAGSGTVDEPGMDTVDLGPGAQLLDLEAVDGGWLTVGRILPTDAPLDPAFAAGRRFPDADPAGFVLALWRSADGLAWEPVSGYVVDGPSSAAGAGPEEPSDSVQVVVDGPEVSVFVAWSGGSREVLRSTDLSTWTAENAEGAPIGRIETRDDRFVSVRPDGPVVSNNEGTEWAAATVSGLPGGQLLWSGPYPLSEQLLASVWEVGAAPERTWLARSTDGMTWTVDDEPLPVDGSVSGIVAWQDRLVAATSLPRDDLAAAPSPIDGRPAFLVLDDGGGTWSEVPAPDPEALSFTLIGTAGDALVVASGRSPFQSDPGWTLWTTTDLVEWRAMLLGGIGPNDELARLSGRVVDDRTVLVALHQGTTTTMMRLRIGQE